MQGTDRRGFLRGAFWAGLGASVAPGAGRAAEPAAGQVDRHLLGSTGREVSIYGLGLGSVFCGAFKDDRDGAAAMLQRAIEVHGINYWDSADDYSAKNKAGETVFSEDLVAGILPRVRDKVFMVSKTNARSYDGFKKSVEKTLKKLGTDHLDCYHLHCLTMRDKLDTLEVGAVKAARELKEQKVLRHWGMTSHLGAKLLLEAARRFDPDIVTCPYPAGRPDPVAEDQLLPHLVEKKIGAVAIKPLRGARNSDLKGTDLVRYTLSLPGMGVVLVGADSIAHIDDLAALATGFKPMPHEERHALSESVRLAVSYEQQTPWLRPGYIDGRIA